MNFSLPKIKFPFKKIKSVCTTEQVIHRVDGQDKKLSDVIGDSIKFTPLKEVVITSTFGEGDRMVLNSDNIDTLFDTYPSMYMFIIEIFKDLCLIPISTSIVAINIEATTENSADLYLVYSNDKGDNEYEFSITFSTETDTEDSVVVIGEITFNPENPIVGSGNNLSGLLQLYSIARTIRETLEKALTLSVVESFFDGTIFDEYDSED